MTVKYVERGGHSAWLGVRLADFCESTGQHGKWRSVSFASELGSIRVFWEGHTHSSVEGSN